MKNIKIEIVLNDDLVKRICELHEVESTESNVKDILNKLKCDLEDDNMLLNILEDLQKYEDC